MTSFFLHQRNFKQKIIALLKRFKVPDEMEGVDRPGRGGNEQDFESLFHELDSLSCGEGDDSGQDMDSLSIGSTPKPSLRPFFTSSTSMMQENSRKGINIYARHYVSVCNCFVFSIFIFIYIFLYFWFGMIVNILYKKIYFMCFFGFFWNTKFGVTSLKIEEQRIIKLFQKFNNY